MIKECVRGGMGEKGVQPKKERERQRQRHLPPLHEVLGRNAMVYCLKIFLAPPQPLATPPYIYVYIYMLGDLTFFSKKRKRK